MNPILGAKDDPSDFEGRHGRVRQELKAQQGQSQGHLHLVHGKLLPDAIPAETQQLSQLHPSAGHSKPSPPTAASSPLQLRGLQAVLWAGAEQEELRGTLGAGDIWSMSMKEGDGGTKGQARRDEVLGLQAGKVCRCLP